MEVKTTEQLKAALLFRADSLKKRAIVCIGFAILMLVGYAAVTAMQMNSLLGFALAALGIIGIAAAVVCGILYSELQTIAEKMGDVQKAAGGK